MQKIDTGIAIVCMVNSTNSYIPVDLNQTSNCLFQLNNKTQVNIILFQISHFFYINFHLNCSLQKVNLIGLKKNKA